MNKDIQIAGFLDNSLVNGKGLRSVVFVSGCNHNCLGCHNKPMQDFNYGDRVRIQDVFLRIKKNVPIIRGVTFSGGEPFEQADKLSELAYLLEKENLNIWCYTGYTFEYILDNLDNKPGWRTLVENIDVLVDGKFDVSKKDERLKYKGSSNQRIIDVKSSINQNKIVIYNL